MLKYQIFWTDYRCEKHVPTDYRFEDIEEALKRVTKLNGEQFGKYYFIKEIL